MDKLGEARREIAFLEGASHFEQVTGGYSGAECYFFQKEGRDYFMKLGIQDCNVDTNLEEVFSTAHITHPAIIELSRTKSGIPYIIEEKANGVTGKSLLDKRHEKYFYEYGFRQGREFSNLKAVYPDRPATSAEIEKEKRYTKDIVDQFDQMVDNTKLNDFSRQFITNLKGYITSHKNIVEHAIYTFGHPDLKLSNLMIDGSKVISIDFQSIKYNNVARSTHCSLIRRHYEENEKHWAYVSGYLDGLYNCNVPDDVYDNLTFYLCLFTLKMFTKILTKEKYQYIDEYCAFLSTTLIANNNIDSRHILGRFYHIRNIKELNGYTFSFVSGSYDPNSFVFRCDNPDKKSYFLKIRRGGQYELDRIRSINSILNSYHYPHPTMIACGLLSGQYTYTIDEFIHTVPYPQLKGQEGFHIGEKLGGQLATYHLSIREHTVPHTQQKDVLQNFFASIMQHVEFILDSNSDYAKLYPYTKQETLAYLEKWKQSYKEDKLYFTHGDLKMANVLYDGKEMYMVDLTSFDLGYELHNFTYTLYSCLLSDYHDKNIFSGWIRGYLKSVYGYLPPFLQDEARAILLFQLVRTMKALIDKNGDTDSLQNCLDMVDKYITKGENIEWLQ